MNSCKWLAIAVLGLSLAGCGEDDDPPEATDYYVKMNGELRVHPLSGALAAASSQALSLEGTSIEVFSAIDRIAGRSARASVASVDVSAEGCANAEKCPWTLDNVRIDDVSVGLAALVEPTTDAAKEAWVKTGSGLVSVAGTAEAISAKKTSLDDLKIFLATKVTVQLAQTIADNLALGLTNVLDNGFILGMVLDGTEPDPVPVADVTVSIPDATEAANAEIVHLNFDASGTPAPAGATDAQGMFLVYNKKASTSLVTATFVAKNAAGEQIRERAAAFEADGVYALMLTP